MTNGVIAELSELQLGRFIFYRRFINVLRAAVLFTEVIEILVIGGKNRLAVFAFISRYFAVVFRLGIIYPYIAGYGGSMVFSPSIFISFAVLKNKLIAFAVEVGKFGARGKIHGGAAAGDRHLIKFHEQTPVRKTRTGIYIVARSAKYDLL